MNSYPTEDGYRNMICSFQAIDLQNLLGAFNFNTNRQKPELQNHALILLLHKPAGFNYEAYLAKINEIYHSVMNDRRQQQQMLNAQPRFYQATPPEPQPQQFMFNVARAQLPQVMPQIPRSILVNNNPGNFQYNQPAGPSRPVPRVPNNRLVNANLQNARIFIPSTQLLENIRLKNLPFYDVLFNVLKPTTLISSEFCSKPEIKKKGMRELTLNIKIELDAINCITLHRNNDEFPHQLQIRICDIESSSVEVADIMPYELHIAVNNKVCPLPPVAPNNKPGTVARRLAYPIHCTPLFKLAPIVLNKIVVNWMPDPKTYIMTINVVKKLSSSVLLERLKKKATRSSDDTKNYIIKKMANNDTEISTTSYKVPLNCPLGKHRLRVPVKSAKCTHLQCFDAETFLLMNEKKPTWLCPTCDQSCFYEDLQIQSYFLDVVSSSRLPVTCREIEILGDGTWKICEEKVVPAESVAGNEKPIILDDSDDENSKDVVPMIQEANPNSSNEGTEVLRTNVVDLTLSDDEELQNVKDVPENEAQATHSVQTPTVVGLKPQVQPKQAVTSSEVIDIDCSPSPPTSPSSPITSNS